MEGNRSSKADEGQITKWTFFCKEVAKANDTLDMIEKLWKNIELHSNAYNHAFVLIIDALTTKIFLHISHLFDSQDDPLRLTRIITGKEHQSKLNELKKEAQPFVEARNREHAHLSKYAKEINYGSNFRLLNEFNAMKIREILDEVGKLLRQWGVTYNNGSIIADHWGNIGWSSELLFENLEEYDFILSEMTTETRIDLRHRMKKDKYA
jgi:hypothetical protein